MLGKSTQNFVIIMTDLIKKSYLDVIYEDSELVVLLKPANLLTLPDRFKPEIPNLYHSLQQKYGKIFIVHRLDRDTSGIICFAKNEIAHAKLSQQFENHEVEKIYVALVDGKMPYDVGEIDLPIIENPAKKGTMMISNFGKPSLTQYKVIQEFIHFTYLKIRLLTGRTHQIRVHFNAVAHPLCVDNVYGTRSNFYLSEIKKRFKTAKNEDERPLLNRLSLHAWELSFTHPSTSETITVTAPLPKDFEVTLKQLQKYDV